MSLCGSGCQGAPVSPFKVTKTKVTIAVELIQAVCVLLAVSAEFIFFEHPERSGFMLTRGRGMRSLLLGISVC